MVRGYGLQEKFQRFMGAQQRREYYEAAAGSIRRYNQLAQQAARHIGCFGKKGWLCIALESKIGEKPTRVFKYDA